MDTNWLIGFADIIIGPCFISAGSYGLGTWISLLGCYMLIVSDISMKIGACK